jgi:hypothetical protein
MIQTPAHLEPYVRILGEDLAIEFFLEFGGAELHLPARPREGSRLVTLVGMERAAALATASNRMQARVPLGKPWIAKVLSEKGWTGAAIGRKLHVSDVTVRSYLKDTPSRKLGKDSRQLPLI